MIGLYVFGREHSKIVFRMKTAATKKFKAVESFKSSLPIRMALRAGYSKYLSMNQPVKMVKQSEYKFFSTKNQL